VRLMGRCDLCARKYGTFVSNRQQQTCRDRHYNLDRFS